MKNKRIWKPVVGFEGFYEVSNYGEIKSLRKEWVCGRNTHRYSKEKLIAQRDSSNGYKTVVLIKGKLRKIMYVHRIVAIAFINNPNNYSIINHKDENPSNNNVDNLEWCTHKYNITYGNARMNNKKYRDIYNAPVVLLNRKGVVVEEFSSIREASSFTKCSIYSIRRCCLQSAKSPDCNFSLWRFKEKPILPSLAV